MSRVISIVIDDRMSEDNQAELAATVRQAVALLTEMSESSGQVEVLDSRPEPNNIGSGVAATLARERVRV